MIWALGPIIDAHRAARLGQRRWHVRRRGARPRLAAAAPCDGRAPPPPHHGAGLRRRRASVLGRPAGKVSPISSCSKKHWSRQNTRRARARQYFSRARLALARRNRPARARPRGIAARIRFSTPVSTGTSWSTASAAPQSARRPAPPITACAWRAMPPRPACAASPPSSRRRRRGELRSGRVPRPTRPTRPGC